MSAFAPKCADIRYRTPLTNGRSVVSLRFSLHFSFHQLISSG
ncbi:hypothetical protein CKO_02151 [Citrobacter koseri ATCC BAA-895]|uniref:Uncharacterized protein n=1 Tax=Citrobacter koseri (strain ATCC BAA-895 / CDC 4225-83 / SGSC4696) TaxID=290338 RepID=A8AIG2_CITK8|nr:hypothetical protein CKO_02151 [Citrobacter koseri ATCC BAA-895]